MFKKLAIVFILIGVLAGCGADTTQSDQTESDLDSTTAESQQNSRDEIVTIENYDRTLEFTEAPQRVFTLATETTEIMLELGLESFIVGALARDVLPKYEEAFSQIPMVLEGGARYPSLEAVLAAEPDFIYARANAFGPNGISPVDDLQNQYNITPYVVTSTYEERAKLEHVYNDIMNIGKIFRVEDKAKALVQQLQDDVADIQANVGAIEKPIKVLIYDSGDSDAMMTAGNQLSSDLIRIAGGVNVFEDLDRGWAQVNWEEVIDRDPEVIAIYDYGNTPAEDKIAALLHNKALQDVKAIKEERFIIIPLASVMEGVRNVSAIEKFAKGLHPDKFN